MGKWTPGPWRVEDDTDMVWGDCDADNQTNSGMGIPIVEGVAWSYRRWGRQLTWEERFANAYLIAAAPDLLEALEECASQIETDTRLLYGEFERQAMLPVALTKARAVIAKAKGKG